MVAYPAGYVAVLVIHCDWACRRYSAPEAGNGTVPLKCNIVNFRFPHFLLSSVMPVSRDDIARSEVILQCSSPAGFGIMSIFPPARGGLSKL